MERTLTLSPLLRHSIGFDRFNDFFESALSGDINGNAYPPYNIVKLGENNYKIVMAVAGFIESDLEITAHNDKLLVRGKVERNEEHDGAEYLHKGIATRSFERTFRLADHMKVKGAGLKNGLLTIEVEREVPEEAKPKTILIKSDSEDALPQ